MSSFSFYFSHHMTTMEGGGIATNNKIYFNDLKSIRSHGWSRDRDDVDDWSIEVHPSLRKFTFISSGYNIRPMEIQAAVGRHQLRDLESMIKRRREIAKYVLDSLRNSQFQVVGAPSSEEVLNFRRHSWMHIPIKINSVEANADRFKVVRYLEDSGIETRPPLTGNFIKQPAMSRFFSDAAKSSIFPNADSIAESTFLVGCHHDLSDLQVEHLANKLVAASNINS
jgi:CDP-6-deoxy-D-xylo-4-hexulose-3-dehydrase